MPNNKIVFFGTPNFSLPALEALLKEKYDIVLVVTKPDQPAGRNLILSPSPVKVYAKKLGLQIYEQINDLNEYLDRENPSLGIVVAYGKIIPLNILGMFPFGCLNIHPSLLPKYRGSSPIQSAILNSDLETGVSIIKLDEKMDHGPIVARKSIEISAEETAESLHDKLSQVGAELLINILPDYLSGKITPKPQDESQATYTKIIAKGDGKIDWRKPAKEIERQIRAFYPWPGSFTEFSQNNRVLKIKIISAEVLEKNPSSVDIVGKLQNVSGRLIVNCGKGSLIINKLQLEGKKEMTDKEFINGYFN